MVAVSTFTWLDRREEDADRVREALAAFDEQAMVDPIGFGVVRDDVVEDTAMTLDDLRQRGCPGAVLDAVDALTRRADETPAEYYVRVAADPIAIAVKRADIADNSDPSRLAALPAEMAQRLRDKYEKATAILGPGD
jgi:hypothetical protein